MLHRNAHTITHSHTHKLSYKPIIVNEFECRIFIELREGRNNRTKKEQKSLSYTYSYQNDERFNEKMFDHSFRNLGKAELFRCCRFHTVHLNESQYVLELNVMRLPKLFVWVFSVRFLFAVALFCICSLYNTATDRKGENHFFDFQVLFARFTKDF